MVSIWYRTRDLITTVISVWSCQHGNQSGRTKSDVQIDPVSEGEDGSTGAANSTTIFILYYCDKSEWHKDTSGFHFKC